MQSVRDNDQQSYFYVVWPDDRAVQQTASGSSNAVTTVVNAAVLSPGEEEEEGGERRSSEPPAACGTVDHEESVHQPTSATAINNAISLVASGGAHERALAAGRPAPAVFDGPDAQCCANNNSANESSSELEEEESASGLSGAASDSDEVAAGGSSPPPPRVDHCTTTTITSVAPPIVRPLFLRHHLDNGTSKSSKNGDIGESRERGAGARRWLLQGEGRAMPTSICAVREFAI